MIIFLFEIFNMFTAILIELSEMIFRMCKLNYNLSIIIITFFFHMIFKITEILSLAFTNFFFLNLNQGTNFFNVVFLCFIVMLLKFSYPVTPRHKYALKY